MVVLFKMPTDLQNREIEDLTLVVMSYENY